MTSKKSNIANFAAQTWVTAMGAVPENANWISPGVRNDIDIIN